MATWQFDFHLIPASSVEKRFSTIPVTLSVQDYDQFDWWANCDQFRSLERELSSLLPRRQSWDSEREVWGEEDGNRFELLRAEERIMELYGRLDMRHLSLAFLNRLIQVLRDGDLLIVTEDRHLLRPYMKELLGAIRRSGSFAFVTDPEGFLSRLRDTE